MKVFSYLVGAVPRLRVKESQNSNRARNRNKQFWVKLAVLFLIWYFSLAVDSKEKVTWERLKQQGAMPSPRDGHSLWSVFWTFSGHSEHTLLV